MSIKIVTIGSTVYLGTLEEGKGGKVTLQNSLCLGNGIEPQKAHLIEYVKAKNTDKLGKDIVIKGLGATFSERDLDDDLTLELEILGLKLKQAEKLAVPELINQKFTQLVGR